MRAVFVFCEGQHDVIFVQRALGIAAGCSWVDKPIRDLPTPLGVRTKGSKSFIHQRYATQRLEDLSLRSATHPPHPSFQSVLRKGDTLFVLMRCHGDHGAGPNLDMLTQMRDLLDVSQGQFDIEQMAAAFLFDADQDLAGRVASFAREYAPCMTQKIPAPAHGQWVAGARYPVGLWVFHDQLSQKGSLEQILGPAVQAAWPGRWQGADLYLKQHGLPHDVVMQKDSEYIKAQINITGQFLFPGDPMTMVIGRGGLPETALNLNEVRDLSRFLTTVPW